MAWLCRLIYGHRRAAASVACLVVAALDLPVWADTNASRPSRKDRHAIFLRLEVMGRAGADGPWAQLDLTSDTGIAEFDSTAGFRVGAEFEVAPGFFVKANVGRSEPTLELTIYDPAGGPDIVQRGSVSMTPFLVGFEFHPRRWREGRVFWGMGLHYGWVRYGSLPPNVDADLESTETVGGFDIRLDVKVGKTPWLAGAEFGLLLRNPVVTDHMTGTTRTAHFSGALWAVGFSRVF